MRYKKGSEVEVFCKDEVPSGSWRCGQVICGNGHHYTIRCIIGAKDEAIFERVSRKSIRPCPPVVHVSRSWMPGDVVEMLHNYSWKMATVSKVLKGNHFLVRLVGSSNEFKVHKFDIRLRQSWMDGKWIVVGKGFGNYDEEKCCEQPCFNYNYISGSFKGIKAKLDSHEEKDCVGTVNNINCQESHIVSKKNLKRVSHNVYPQAKAPESARKFRAIEKGGRHHRVIVADPSPLPEKVENYPYPKKLPGGKDICCLLNNKTTIFSQTDEGRIRIIDVAQYSNSRTSDCNDVDDDVSSVGSCSIGWDNPIKWPSRILACPVGYADDHSSDAESVCPLNKEEENYLQPNDEELAVEIHRLELHAYRCTLGALYALGPLSWEQETLMTNLRISLHISNDEHLMELRNLTSSATGIHVS
ncbi:uncharacterized protein LOC113775755 [Coffea eugenioides]|uniref:uncharacterized protein LOC113775755 n=1 Tax=Coffea eugenioides TaxID=49369 RepID=UPI000F60898E|nr:uncharacterized protein LOC113775755 [Coffea eugenioides]XP_027176558.1 uncharacterized protein LOC113775755 [Coffea eugenioides]